MPRSEGANSTAKARRSNRPSGDEIDGRRAIHPWILFKGEFEKSRVGGVPKLLIDDCDYVLTLPGGAGSIGVTFLNGYIFLLTFSSKEN